MDQTDAAAQLLALLDQRRADVKVYKRALKARKRLGLAVLAEVALMSHQMDGWLIGHSGRPESKKAGDR